jgi:hypothetical protein
VAFLLWGQEHGTANRELPDAAGSSPVAARHIRASGSSQDSPELVPPSAQPTSTYSAREASADPPGGPSGVVASERSRKPSSQRWSRGERVMTNQAFNTVRPGDNQSAGRACELGRRMLMARRVRRQWFSDRVEFLYLLGRITLREFHHLTCPAFCSCRARISFREGIRVVHAPRCPVHRRCTCSPRISVAIQP